MSENPICHGVFFGSPLVRATPYDGNPYIETPVEIRQEFINEMDCQLTVVLRNGLPLKLPATLGRNHRRLTIRQTIILRRDGSSTVTEFLNQITDKSPITLRVLKQAYERHAPNYGPRTPIVLQLDYVITREDLRRYGNTLYYHGADCVISTNTDPAELMHPHSDSGQLHATDVAVTPTPIREGGALFAVEIVDNLSAFGDRYLNIANQIYPVRAKRDPTRADGVYVTRTDPTHGELGSGELKVNYYPFVDADGNATDFAMLHLYPGYKDAVTLGDIAAARKEELVQMEHELQLGKRTLEELRQESDRRKQEWDQSRLEHERENLRLKDQLDERERRYREIEVERERIAHDLDLERLRKKDHYEERSQVRKDTGEWVKTAPALILGVAAVTTAIFSVLRKG